MRSLTELGLTEGLLLAGVAAAFVGGAATLRNPCLTIPNGAGSAACFSFFGEPKGV